MRLSWRMFRSLIPPTLGLSEDDQRRIIGDAMRGRRGTQGSRWHTVVQCVLIIPLVVLLNSRQFGLLRFLPDWAQMPVLIGVVSGFLIGGGFTSPGSLGCPGVCTPNFATWGMMFAGAAAITAMD